jgi:hypothetical protein
MHIKDDSTEKGFVMLIFNRYVTMILSVLKVITCIRYI